MGSLFALVASLAACKGEAPKAEPISKPAKVEAPAAGKKGEDRMELAVKVARAIDHTPEQADTILSEHGLDRESLEALMFEIAKDPALRKKFLQARKKPTR